MSIKTSFPKYQRFLIILIVMGSTVLLFFFFSNSKQNQNPSNTETKIISGSFDESKLKPDEEWKKILTPEQFHILREKGTDLPFTKDLTNNKEKGTYVTVGCNEPVFRSEQKYDSGTGWPSFTAPIDEDSLVLSEDYELGYKRIEIMDKCGNHLGHVFDDGPTPTGKRYCINATALKFIPD